MKLLLILFLGAANAWFYGRDAPDRWSIGGVWPLPQKITYDTKNRTISYERIRIDLGEKKDCDILLAMADSYMNKWLFPFPVQQNYNAEDFIITFSVKDDCPKGTPEHNASEEYYLSVSTSEAVIRSDTVWGALRAMESLSQLVFYDFRSKQYQIRTAEVYDKPRFPVRGIMIDSSRHFLSVNVIKRQIDIMAMNKMNVLHWHLVDSESFPYTSEKFPELHSLGAYSPRHVYSRRDISDVINYARLRGVRVIPEFDLPGHTGSWKGRKGFLADCYDNTGKSTDQNLIDPVNEENFDFLEEFLDEVTETFPDQYMHLGGDEVQYYVHDCWVNNPRIQKFMRDQGYGNNTVLLENYFFARLYKILDSMKNQRKPIFWQEVVDNNVPKPGSTIHIWKGDTHEEIYEQINNITKQNFPVIVSACWYLNYIKYGADWRYTISGNEAAKSRYYYCDPTNFNGTDEQKALVQGGIAAIWGEFVDDTNLEARLWPRASAAAERLWSPAEKTQSADEAWPRLHELRCRLVNRGFRLQPINNPDFCPFEYEESYGKI